MGKRLIEAIRYAAGFALLLWFVVASVEWSAMIENLLDNSTQWLILFWLTFAFFYSGASEKGGHSSKAVFETAAFALVVAMIFMLLTNGRGCTSSQSLRYDTNDTECVPAGPGIYGC
jgi:hypothetical protein